MIVTLNDQVDPLAHEHVHESGLDLASGRAGAYADLVHQHDDPLDAECPGVVDSVGDPVVIVGPDRIGYRAASRGSVPYSRVNTDETGDWCVCWIVEIVPEAIGAGFAAKGERAVLEEFVDTAAPIGNIVLPGLMVSNRQLDIGHGSAFECLTPCLLVLCAGWKTVEKVAVGEDKVRIVPMHTSPDISR